MEELLARFSVKQKIMVLVSVVFIATMLVLGIVLDRVITNHEMNKFVEETDLQATQVDTSMDLFLRGLRDGFSTRHTLKKVNEKEVPFSRYLRIECRFIAATFFYIRQRAEKRRAAAHD